MSTNPKVSVIVPVYNAEPYLSQCLDSIVNQTLEDIEIICVDDGSTDGSLETLGRYAEQDGRITVLFQEHKFAGIARNAGKKIAKGKYLVFWDSDDYFKADALKLMYEQCEADEADICICGGRQYYEEQGFEAPGPRYIKKSEIPEVIPFNRHTAPDHILTISEVAAWNKMFRRDFIERIRLDFKGTRNANDVFFTQVALCLADRITLVNKALVVYRKGKSGGLVSTISKGILTAFQTWLDTAAYLKEQDAFPERTFANRSLESIVYLFNNTREWEAFREAFYFLQAEGRLDMLGIIPKEDDAYYAISYHNEVARRLRENTPEEFNRYLGNLFALREASTTARMRRSDENNKKTINSLKKKNSELEAKEKSASEMLKKSTKEAEELKAAVTGQEEQIAALKKQLDDVKQQRDDMKKQRDSAAKKQAAAEKKLADIRSSMSFRIGRILTWLPRKLKQLLKR